MTDPEPPVVVSGKYGREVYHTDPDCPQWPQNPRRASDTELDELRECVKCSGDWNPDGSGNGHFQSLIAASKANAGGADDE